MFVQFHYNFKDKDIAHVALGYHLLREILSKILVNIFAKLNKHVLSNKSVPEAYTLLLSLEDLLVLGLTTNASIKIDLLA